MLSAGATGQAPSPGAPAAGDDGVVALGEGDEDGDGSAEAVGGAERPVGVDVTDVEAAAGVDPCDPASTLANPPPITATAARPSTGVLSHAGRDLPRVCRARSGMVRAFPPG